VQILVNTVIKTYSYQRTTLLSIYKTSCHCYKNKFSDIRKLVDHIGLVQYTDLFIAPSVSAVLMKEENNCLQTFHLRRK